MYRTLLIVLLVAGGLTLAVKLLRANWRDAGRQARDLGTDLVAKGRDAGEPLAERAGELGARAGERASDLGARAGELGERGLERTEALRDKAAELAGAVTARHGDRLAARLERTLVVDAPVEQVAPLVAAAMTQAPLFDAVPVEPDEQAAWVYEALGTVRLALTADPRATAGHATAAPSAQRCVVGVVRYDVVMGEPQGGPATEHAIDQVLGVLATHELTVQQIQRAFAGPGLGAADDTSDGPRTAGPLPAPGISDDEAPVRED